MAFTTSMITQSVFGNMRVVFANVTADAAEGTASMAPLTSMFAASVTPIKQASFVASGNTAQTYVNYMINAGTTATVIAGTIGFSGCVSTNQYFVVAYGE